MSSWQSYIRNAFVDRPEILGEIQHWADDPAADRQVLSLIAPRGTGKTWMLRYLQDIWQGNRLVIWVDAKELVNLAEKMNRENVLVPASVTHWLENTFAEARKFCTHIPPCLPPPKMTYGRSLEQLVIATCQRCKLWPPPVVLVDGYDDVETIQAEVLSDQLLTSFVSDECWRMIIARREQRPLLVYKLKSNSDREVSDRLKVLFSTSRNIGFAKQQFRRFLNVHRQAVLVEDGFFTGWFEKLKEYHWGHPFINAFLFDTALQDGTPPLRQLTKKDLEECFRATIRRRAPIGQTPQGTAALPSDDLDLLLKIAGELEEIWTEHDLDEKLGIKFGEESERIFDTGIIVSVPGYYSRYKIADGLRELLREINALS
jgi:hypothetical protein